jgi:transcriptional regulator with XRE-family HTH domain
MPKNLSDALKAAKTKRNVLSKQIIWESGVSKSQFYRIINGEEAPSPETRLKICEALGIEVETFDALQQNSKPSDRISDDQNLEGRNKRTWILPAFAASAVAVLAIFLVAINRPASAALEPPVDVAELEDSTLFIKDVTIPDGTSIPINTTFEKIWRVKNTGKVVWKDRYLQRMTPATSLICSSPSRVPIPETKPGEVIDIAVTFTTPYLPGSCRTDWKTTDKDGNVYFPDMHGLYSIVVVTAE